MGVIGRNRKEVGLLVQTAFKKYNAVRQSEENNRNENYVRVSAPDPGTTTSSLSMADRGDHTGKLVDLDHHEGTYGSAGGNHPGVSGNGGVGGGSSHPGH